MSERDIFLAAIEIADLAQRALYVEQACGDDAELRAQVEELLKTHQQTSQFLETPAARPAFDQTEFDQTRLIDKSGSDDISQRADASGETEFRSYLEPTTRPGWLGRLAHYEIEEILGRGAFGIVARAFDEKLHRVVAIKLLSPELASTSPPRKRFLREARTAAAVMHENIVAIHAVEEEPIPYLVMEYIPGQTLQQQMDGHGPLEVTDVLRIGQQVAAGLAAAHSANLIHRDIKPSNILLPDGPASRVKISDFGLARAVDDASMTRSGMIAGTPMYMAPEQARGEVLDHRADLFSLGSVLYQMASGRPPFRAANTVAVLKRVCEDTPRPLYDVIPGIPDWLETIVFRLLEKDRNDRYQTAQEVADLLARCRSEFEHNGKVTCVTARPGNQPTRQMKAFRSEYAPTPKERTRNGKLGWLIGGAIALVIGAIAYVNAPGPKAWPRGAWDAADHNQDGQVTREEMELFGSQGSHRNVPRLLWHFESADKNHDGIVDDAEIEAYGYNVGSKDPNDHLPPPIASTVQRANGESTGHAGTANSGGGWIEIFNGEDLDGWQGDDQAWAVRDGLLVTTGLTSEAGGRLIYKRQRFEDVHILAECRLGPAGNSGLVARTTDAPGIFGGYEAQLTSPNARGKGDQDLYGMGSLYGLVPQDLNILPGTWFTAELIVVGPHVTVRINGKTTASHQLDVTAPESVESTFIALARLHSEQDIAFRRVAARDLSHIRNHLLSGLVHSPSPAIAPFDAQQARAHQEAWAKHLGVPVEYENSIGMKFRLIPPGEFLMGSTPEEVEAALKVAGDDEVQRERINSEAPQHKVVLTQPIYVGVTEVTQTQYGRIMGTNPSHFSAKGEGKDAVVNLETGNHPVEMVSWNDAAEFCAKLSQQEKLKPFYFRSVESVTLLDGTGYRLPTEAEWEYSCRAGTTTRFWSGDEDQDLIEVGWIASNSYSRTHAVGKLKANPFGLWDVHGNVWEWVQDSWDSAFYGKFKENAAIDPSGPVFADSRRVLHGGSWYYESTACRSSNRGTTYPVTRTGLIGFRVVLVAESVRVSRP